MTASELAGDSQVTRRFSCAQYYAPYFMHQQSLLGIPSRFWGRKVRIQLRDSGLLWQAWESRRQLRFIAEFGQVCISFFYTTFWFFWPLTRLLYCRACIDGGDMPKEFFLSVRSAIYCIVFVNSHMILFCTPLSSRSWLELVSLLKSILIKYGAQVFSFANHSS